MKIKTKSRSLEQKEDSSERKLLIERFLAKNKKLFQTVKNIFPQTLFLHLAHVKYFVCGCSWLEFVTRFTRRKLFWIFPSCWRELPSYQTLPISQRVLHFLVNHRLSASDSGVGGWAVKYFLTPLSTLVVTAEEENRSGKAPVVTLVKIIKVKIWWKSQPSS